MGTVIGLGALRSKITLLLNLVAAEKIMTLRIAPLKILCLEAKRKQRDLRNPGNLKPGIDVDQKKDLKENENNT